MFLRRWILGHGSVHSNWNIYLIKILNNYNSIIIFFGDKRPQITQTDNQHYKVIRKSFSFSSPWPAIHFDHPPSIFKSSSSHRSNAQLINFSQTCRADNARCFVYSTICKRDRYKNSFKNEFIHPDVCVHAPTYTTVTSSRRRGPIYRVFRLFIKLKPCKIL